MKHFSINFVLVVLFALVSTSTAQVNWTKDTLNNPVLESGPPGDWDELYPQHSCVIYEGNEYHMWYTAASSAGYFNIGYATSPDGITWTKYDDPATPFPPYAESDPVLFRGNAGSWDENFVFTPYVVYDGSVYHMWYTGSIPNNTNIRIGYATSTDGGITWTKYDDPATPNPPYAESDPVLIPGPTGSWDELTVETPAVIIEGNSYTMWYKGLNYSLIGGIGRATSADGIHWNKGPLPVLSPSQSWEQGWLRLGSVFYDGEKYHMFYYGGLFYVNFSIGYAWSSNGIIWTKYEDNPVLEPGSANSWDDRQVLAPSVVLDADTLRMWYTGADTTYPPASVVSAIGYATSPADCVIIGIINVPGEVATIQGAIDIASDGNIVLVEDSTYYENINFKGKAITVASRFIMDGDTNHINNTIIDGSQPSHPDTGSVVRFTSGEDTTSVLMGFTITNGTGTKLISTGSGNNFPLRAGGGILCWNSGGRFVRNKIINNTLNDSTLALGGGFSAGDIGSNEWVILEKNQIENNMVNDADGAYGGGIGLTCNAKIINNIISNNSCISTAYIAPGGGIDGTNDVNEQRTLLIEDNTITSNFNKGTGVAAQNNFAAVGGGINLYGRFKASILRNEISDNQLKSFNNGHGEGGGIYMYLSESGSVISGNKISKNISDCAGINYGGGMGLSTFSGLSITNNIITRNSASLGGGIRLRYNNAEIINNTIINNTATNGGGLHGENSQPLVSNSILWNNQAVNGAGIYPPSLTNVRYSDVQGGYMGTGNKNVDPFFADTLNYELSDSSLCIGGGIDSIQINAVWYYAPDHDFDGDPRPYPSGCNPDIGAQESPLCEPLDVIEPLPGVLPFTYSLRQNYPNPFNPATNIEFSIPKSEFVTLRVYNILGEEVAALVSEKLTAGQYEYDWNASRLASGVYMYRIQAGEYVETKKMVLLR